MPIVLARLAWRARKQPDYLAHLGERFGKLPAPRSPCIWLHAVSVGETRAAQPLLRALLREFPAHHILLTHMTPTGRATGRELFGKEARIQQAWLPYDIGLFTRAFFMRVRPDFGIVMETEVWPNLMHAAEHANVPVLLANARLSERSARGYARAAALTRPAFGRFTCVAAQSDDDAARLRASGAREVSVTGNIKYDVEIPAAMTELGGRFRARIGSRPVLLAASTREGEEALLLDAFRQQLRDNTLLVIVPRHPQRFDEVAALATQAGLKLARRSDEQNVAADTQVWLGDSMGEMAAYYAAADVTLMGGSWLPFGSQNLIESCAAGVPVIIGPSSFNFAEASELALSAGAALRSEDVETGMRAAMGLLADSTRRAQMREAALKFCATHKGATARIIEAVRATL